MKIVRMKLLALVPFTIALQSWAAQTNDVSKVKLVSPTSITADPAKGQTEGVLTFKNESAAAVTLALTAKPGDNAPVQASFSAEKDTGPGTDGYSVSIPANGTANVRAVVRSSDIK